MRILDKGNLRARHEKLGFERAENYDWYKEAIVQAVRDGAGHRPHRLRQDDDALLGALIVNTDTNIMTAEDPVEYNFAGINQVQMQRRPG
jgi:type IV pilus assembly protein PilB